MNIMEVVSYNNKYFDGVNDIYNRSFPKCERYMLLEDLLKAEHTQLHCLVDGDDVKGFVYTIHYNKLVFILYLAVNEKERLKGYGSVLMKWCLNNYKDCKVFLNIDELDDKKEDFEVRKRRLCFYQKNGLYISNIMSSDKSENFHVLSNQQVVDIDEYTTLDNFVAKVLDADLSQIKKVDLLKNYISALDEQTIITIREHNAHFVV